MNIFMKKFLAIFLILALTLSFAACGDDGKDKNDEGSKPADTKTEDTVDENDIVYAEKDEILGLAKSAPAYAGIDCITQTQIYSVYTQKTLLTELASYKRDADGNVVTMVYNEEGTPISAEYVIGSEYYSGALTDGDGVKASLSDDEKASVTESLKAKGADAFLYSFDDFSNIEAVDNEDGTYTLICSSKEEAVTGKLAREIKDEFDIAYEGYESYNVTSVDYQYTVDADGKLKGFVVMASVEVTMPEADKAEDETTSYFTFGNYVSFIYAAVVNEYAETIGTDSVTLTGVNVTESTYSELFGE